MKWIKENIEFFGGDTNSITIAGMSAGGASIEFQFLFSESEGEYQKINVFESEINSDL